MEGARTVKRSVSIYVVGPSSTGKTTLCAALSEKLGLDESAYVTEVARHIMRTKGYTRENIGSIQMQEDIMEGHLQRDEENWKTLPVRVCDRSAIDPIVYAILTSPDKDEARRRQDHLTHSARFQKALRRYRQSIVILLTPVAEWLVDDGVRSTENQDECLKIFRQLLQELDIPYHELGRGTMYLQERVAVTMGLARF
ncbi:AAA domain-containing protein [Crassisporium funariophilum]|nr:AAA domain-containing protein [Crassisporium funariophilum]